MINLRLPIFEGKSSLIFQFPHQHNSSMGPHEILEPSHRDRSPVTHHRARSPVTATTPGLGTGTKVRGSRKKVIWRSAPVGALFILCF